MPIFIRCAFLLKDFLRSWLLHLWVLLQEKMESKIMSVISSKFECLPIKSSLWTRKYRSGHVTWQLPERGELKGRGVSSPLAIFLTSYVWIETKSSIFFSFF